jgi:hypothetical protein
MHCQIARHNFRVRKYCGKYFCAFAQTNPNLKYTFTGKPVVSEKPVGPAPLRSDPVRPTPDLADRTAGALAGCDSVTGMQAFWIGLADHEGEPVSFVTMFGQAGQGIWKMSDDAATPPYSVSA